MWFIEFVNEKALQEFENLPNDIKARMAHIIKLLEVYGNTLGKPHTASLGEGFFEIRAKSSEGIARSVYCYQIGKKILILATAIKKQNKLPTSVMEIAKNRLKEFENGNN
ncbi:type II toxin-antitoxin system RelE/ParE family toxin [Helicobacter sp. UBA3407]|uniref:type II toxin-antitoxin system RelE/ParE family toxin n=1 Tax=Helicobacter TaxID=209 RepID=UPI0026117816|nr:type II toxin-antitoxin system RelE/ParE family toxin [Helicobacter sp. UBA3407]